MPSFMSVPTFSIAVRSRFQVRPMLHPSRSHSEPTLNPAVQPLPRDKAVSFLACFQAPSPARSPSKFELGWRPAKREEPRDERNPTSSDRDRCGGWHRQAITRGLLAVGIKVAGVDRDREPLEALAASAGEQGKGDDFLTVQTDLTNDSAADEITKATRARFGRIGILVNNAEIGPGFDHGAARAQLS